MEQNINLYREELDVRREWPAHWRLGGLLILSTLAGLFLWTVEYHAAEQRSDHLTEVLEARQQAEDQLESLRALRDAPEVREAREDAEDIELRRDRLAEAEAQLETRLQQAEASAPGVPMTALARAAAGSQPPGIRIVGLRIDGETGDLTIEGHTLDTDDLPDYLEALVAEEPGRRDRSTELELSAGERGLQFVYRLLGDAR